MRLGPSLLKITGVPENESEKGQKEQTADLKASSFFQEHIKETLLKLLYISFLCPTCNTSTTTLSSWVSCQASYDD